MRLPRAIRPGLIVQKAPVTRDIISQLDRAAADDQISPDDAAIQALARQDGNIRDEYINACAEFIANILILSGSLPRDAADIYIPQEVSWTKGLL
jgi:hypothetical protein